MRNSRWWAILAAPAVVIAVALLIAPTGISQTCTATSGGPEVCTQGTTSLLSEEGLWVLVPLGVPALACLLPAILPARWIGHLVAAALLLSCFLSGFTIGLFFLPVAVAALVLALWSHGSPPAAQRRGPGLCKAKIDQPWIVPNSFLARVVLGISKEKSRFSS